MQPCPTHFPPTNTPSPDPKKKETKKGRERLSLGEGPPPVRDTQLSQDQSSMTGVHAHTVGTLARSGRMRQARWARRRALQGSRPTRRPRLAHNLWLHFSQERYATQAHSGLCTTRLQTAVQRSPHLTIDPAESYKHCQSLKILMQTARRKQGWAVLSVKALQVGPAQMPEQAGESSDSRDCLGGLVVGTAIEAGPDSRDCHNLKVCRQPVLSNAGVHVWARPGLAKHP